MSDIRDVLQRIEERLAAVGLTASSASKKAGLGVDAIRNMRRAVGAGDPSRKGANVRTIMALAPVLQTSVAYLMDGIGAADATSPARGGLSQIPVIGTVEAGAFRAVEEYDDLEPDLVADVPDHEFPEARQVAFTVAGDSMNALTPRPILPGDRVIAIDFDDLRGRLPLRNGMVVIVEQTLDGGLHREWSVKQVETYQDRIEFHPRSTSRRHKPIVVDYDFRADDGREVRVLAIARRIINELPLS